MDEVAITSRDSSGFATAMQPTPTEDVENLLSRLCLGSRLALHQRNCRCRIDAALADDYDVFLATGAKIINVHVKIQAGRKAST
jgi:hypothetical protein